MQKFEIEIGSKGGGGYVFANEVIQADESDKLDARLYDHEMILCRKEYDHSPNGMYAEKFCIHRIAYRDIASVELYGWQDCLNLHIATRTMYFNAFSALEDVEECRKRVLGYVPKMSVEVMVHSETSKTFLRELLVALRERLEGEGDIYALVESDQKSGAYKKEVLLGEVGKRERGYETVVEYTTSLTHASRIRTYILLDDALLIGENCGEWRETRVPLTSLTSLVEKPYGVNKTIFVLNYTDNDKVCVMSEVFIYNEFAVRDFRGFFERIKEKNSAFLLQTPISYRGRNSLGDLIKTYTTNDGMTIKLYKNGLSFNDAECLYRDIVCLDNKKDYAGRHLMIHAKPTVPFGVWYIFKDLQMYLEVYNKIEERAKFLGARFVSREPFETKRTLHLPLFGPLSLALPSPTKIFFGAQQHTLKMKADGFEVSYIAGKETQFVRFDEVLSIQITYKGNLFLYTKKGYMDFFDSEDDALPNFRKKLIEKVKSSSPDIPFDDYSGFIYI
jgi:hypothetical protein